uniref:Endonuclease/exonuclease/phosphatase domain-containing protein n=1 Tax=Aegilops tauschii subsp. strangulata TaxID=200361 RepID=A0A453RB68_AEGTS
YRTRPIPFPSHPDLTHPPLAGPPPQVAAMAYNPSRARLSPPAPAAPRPRKRGRSPSAPGAAVWRASAYVSPFDHRRRWQDPAGASGRVWQGYHAPHAPVPSRRWVFADEVSTSGSDACTIMSYNILADNNARNHPDLYLDVPWDALRWDSRRRLIIHEIRHWDSDLVCLQARTRPANWRCHPSTVLCNTLCLENRRWIDSGKSLQK